MVIWPQRSVMGLGDWQQIGLEPIRHALLQPLFQGGAPFVLGQVFDPDTNFTEGDDTREKGLRVRGFEPTLDLQTGLWFYELRDHVSIDQKTAHCRLTGQRSADNLFAAPASALIRAAESPAGTARNSGGACAEMRAQSSIFHAMRRAPARSLRRPNESVRAGFLPVPAAPLPV